MLENVVIRAFHLSLLNERLLFANKVNKAFMPILNRRLPKYLHFLVIIFMYLNTFDAPGILKLLQ